MQKIYFLLTTIALTIFLSACSQTSKTPKGNAEVQEKAPENLEENASEKSINAGERLGSRLDELGVSLTEDQRARLDEISRKYDMSRLGSQDERRAMRQQMQNEISNILTPEQRAKLDQNRKARNGASGG